MQLPARVMHQALRRWRADRCSLASSSLAFQTALALVPLLAVGFALLKATGQLEARSTLLAAVAELLLPSSPDARDEIVQRLAGFADNIAAGAMGSMGLVATLTVSFMLFLQVESFWNSVWSSPQRRGFLNRFLLFYAAVTLLPFLMAVSLGHVAPMWRRIGGIGLILSYASTLAIFTVGNKIMPVVRVEWRSALWGGTVSGVLFELAKYAFSLYLARIIGSYRSIYGALGLLPLFFLWIYFAWLIMLLGIEVAHAVQRLPALEAAERSDEGDEERFVMVSGALALHLLGDVARHFAEGHKALPEDTIEERYRLSEKAVRLIFRRLQECDLVLRTEAGYLLARPADRIPVDEVLRAFQPFVPERGEEDPVGGLLDDLDQRTGERIDKMTLADLA